MIVFLGWESILPIRMTGPHWIYFSENRWKSMRKMKNNRFLLKHTYFLLLQINLIMDKSKFNLRR